MNIQTFTGWFFVEVYENSVGDVFDKVEDTIVNLFHHKLPVLEGKFLACKNLIIMLLFNAMQKMYKLYKEIKSRENIISL